ncbi:8934_t:CDS:2 [Dentiscutata erythropus]|uniref:8934_t:CDS:1 n=1 Tax=Dentiscutata erythropus TaxID=1348616 RepID=A0A9N8ZSY9_9GLOM|nr:8934_t:CDS:2 [Dentiscutata erythropus]
MHMIITLLSSALLNSTAAFLPMSSPKPADTLNGKRAIKKHRKNSKEKKNELFIFLEIDKKNSARW